MIGRRLAHRVSCMSAAARVVLLVVNVQGFAQSRFNQETETRCGLTYVCPKSALESCGFVGQRCTKFTLPKRCQGKSADAVPC